MKIFINLLAVAFTLVVFTIIYGELRKFMPLSDALMVFFHMFTACLFISHLMNAAGKWAVNLIHSKKKRGR